MSIITAICAQKDRKKPSKFCQDSRPLGLESKNISNMILNHYAVKFGTADLKFRKNVYFLFLYFGDNL
jgi:hypothetical protein